MLGVGLAAPIVGPTVVVRVVLTVVGVGVSDAVNMRQRQANVGRGENISRNPPLTVPLLLAERTDGSVVSKVQSATTGNAVLLAHIGNLRRLHVEQAVDVGIRRPAERIEPIAVHRDGRLIDDTDRGIKVEGQVIPALTLLRCAHRVPQVTQIDVGVQRPVVGIHPAGAESDTCHEKHHERQNKQLPQIHRTPPIGWWGTRPRVRKTRNKTVKQTPLRGRISFLSFLRPRSKLSK